jgi:hypothetical protein
MYCVALGRRPRRTVQVRLRALAVARLVSATLSSRLATIVVKHPGWSLGRSLAQGVAKAGPAEDCSRKVGVYRFRLDHSLNRKLSADRRPRAPAKSSSPLWGASDVRTGKSKKQKSNASK